MIDEICDQPIKRSVTETLLINETFSKIHLKYFEFLSYSRHFKTGLYLKQQCSGLITFAYVLSKLEHIAFNLSLKENQISANLCLLSFKKTLGLKL